MRGGEVSFVAEKSGLARREATDKAQIRELIDGVAFFVLHRCGRSSTARWTRRRRRRRSSRTTVRAGASRYKEGWKAARRRSPLPEPRAAARRRLGNRQLGL